MARVTLKELQEQLAEISRRIATLEQHGGEDAVASAPAVEAASPEISEEELLAISAAIGAYLGVRAHIRQIRLVSTNAWAQQGRVSIQASHTLQG
jgi:methylmalonyl-CoA carboxyltransferase large subunit